MNLKGHIKIFKGKELIFEKNNLIVDDGLDQVAALLDGSSVVPIDGIEVGDSNTPAAATDTTLVSALSNLKKPIITTTNNIMNCASSWFAGQATGTWAELGLWTGTWVGPVFTKHKLLSRVILDPVVIKAAGTELSATWIITVNRKTSI